MGTSINVDATQLRANMQKGMDHTIIIPVQITDNPSTKADSPAATVDISENGRDALKNSSFSFSGGFAGWKTTEEFRDYSWDMAEKSGIKKGVLMTDYDYVIPSKLNAMTNNSWHNKSYEEKTNDLLSAYANLYEDIVNGYAAGTREVYVEDPDSEEGFRKLDMETEISELDKAFSAYVDRFKRDYEVGKKATADIAESLNRLAKAGARVDKTRIENTSDSLKEYSKNSVTDETMSKLLEATKKFKQQFMFGGNVSSILNNLMVFDLSGREK